MKSSSEKCWDDLFISCLNVVSKNILDFILNNNLKNENGISVTVIGMKYTVTFMLIGLTSGYIKIL